MPAPDSIEFDDPSTCITESPSSLPLGRLLVGPSSSWLYSGIIHSEMKSARAYALIEGLGKNFMSNSMSSIAHFANHPNMSGRCKTILRG